MDAYANTNHQESIALFGPTQSGKDWLIRAFAKEIEKINQRRDQLFFYELMQVQRDNSLVPAIAYPPSGTAATTEAEDYLYQFTRRAVNNRYQCYEHTHNIIIQNDSGGSLVSTILNADIFATTYHRLINARNLIIIIAPPESSSNKFQQTTPRDEVSSKIDDLIGRQSRQERSDSDFLPSIATHASWSVDDYQRFITLLFDALSRSNMAVGRRNIAICFTKIDQTRIQREDSEKVFYSFFPGLRSLVQLKRKTDNVEFFQTSSAGFINSTDELGRMIQAPNITGSNLRDEARWSPFGTTRPFFWIFESLEREYFERNYGGLRAIFNPRPEYPPYIR